MFSAVWPEKSMDGVGAVGALHALENQRINGPMTREDKVFIPSAYHWRTIA